MQNDFGLSKRAAAQGYAASQPFCRVAAQERDADFEHELRLSALRDRIRYVSREELDRL